jgi:hypothetical protein
MSGGGFGRIQGQVQDRQPALLLVIRDLLWMNFT